MKIKTKTIAALIAATAAITSGISEATNRTLILLQESRAEKSYLRNHLPDTRAVDRIVDTFAPLGQSAKFRALAQNRYQRFVDLSDVNCTRENLLRELIKHSRDGFVIDLAIIGHGDTDVLSPINGGLLVGSPRFPTVNSRGMDPRHIRNLLVDARLRERNPSFTFNLRLVHMFNSFGGTLNDDWLAIGAKVSVGAPRIDWMPEPMNTFFWDDFTQKNRTVSKAAADSLAASRPFYTGLPIYNIVNPATGLNPLDETQQLVIGDRNLIFRDEFRMARNETRTFTINARSADTFLRVFTEPNQRYTFTTSRDVWHDGGFLSPNVTAAGHSNSLPGLRRFPQFNAMSLCAERFNTLSTGLSNAVPNSGFRIGTVHSRTFANTGFLDMFANDNVYIDNRGSVRVTVTRIQ